MFKNYLGSTDQLSNFHIFSNQRYEFYILHKFFFMSKYLIIVLSDEALWKT